MFTTAFRDARSAISAAALGRRPVLVGSAERGGDARRAGAAGSPQVSAGDTRSAAFRTIARTLWLNCSASTLMPSTYLALERHRQERLCFLQSGPALDSSEQLDCVVYRTAMTPVDNAYRVLRSTH